MAMRLDSPELGGADVEIVSFRLPEGESQRLRSLGVFEGQTVFIAQSTPTILMVAGGRIAVAADVASRIEVRVAG